MTSRQKAKGNSFERDLAAYLSELYSDRFVRVPNSGAFIGGANAHRKQLLSENQIKSFKGDIIPPDSWTKFNAEAKSYADFPFHQVLTGSCKQLESWLDQLMEVSDEGDLNIVFIKLNRKGKFVVVESKYTWVTDQFMYYTSQNHKDWLIIEFDHFFKHNRDLLKAYSGPSSDNQLKTTTETNSNNISIQN
jgi:hypothetical protein